MRSGSPSGLILKGCYDTFEYSEIVNIEMPTLYPCISLCEAFGSGTSQRKATWLFILCTLF